jgi:hypothetical protein
VPGWSSQADRQSHKLKVVGSNPAPATILKEAIMAKPKLLEIILTTANVTDSNEYRDSAASIFVGADISEVRAQDLIDTGRAVDATPVVQTELSVSK